MKEHYIDSVTRLSEKELKNVLKLAEPPVAIVGGWAVYFLVNPGFQEEQGRSYIGSRDIDLGVHVDPEWTSSGIIKEAVAKTLASLEKEYIRSRFGFQQHFHQDTGKRLTPDEARELPLHELFDLFIDIIPDTPHLDAFQNAFGFRPPAEPMLEKVFQGEADQLSKYVPWGVKSVLVPSPALMAAMKVRSLPDREKGHKKVKDVADLHALLWYVKPYTEIKEEVLRLVTEEDLQKLKDIEKRFFEEAGTLLQVEPELIRETITRLLA